jgi:2-polyprenyl-3-methyl-5-hydroxy-6-metoxy-1,4-benzoquinol methylase
MIFYYEKDRFMYSFENQYTELLAKYYSRIFCGDEINYQKNKDFFLKFNVPYKNNAIALDLGAGCGFQSFPLAELGCDVIAIDLIKELLNEIETVGKS